MKELKSCMNEDTYNIVNDNYLEVVGNVSNCKITKGFELNTYNLFEALFNELYCVNNNLRKGVSKEEIEAIFSDNEIERFQISSKNLVKLTPAQYTEAISIDPKKVDKENCIISSASRNILVDGKKMLNITYIDRCVADSIGKLYIKRWTPNGFKDYYLIQIFAREFDDYYFVFEHNCVEELMSIKNGFGIKYVLDSLKLKSIYSKNLFSYICRNYDMIWTGHKYNKFTKDFNGHEYEGEDVKEVLAKLGLTKYKTPGEAIRVLKKSVEEINKVLNFGLSMNEIKNGIEGKTSTIEKIKFTLEDNEKRNFRYSSKYAKSRKKNQENKNIQKSNSSNTRNRSYQITSPPREKQEKTPEKLSNKTY